MITLADSYKTILSLLRKEACKLATDPRMESNAPAVRSFWISEMLLVYSAVRTIIELVPGDDPTSTDIANEGWRIQYDIIDPAMRKV